MHSFANHGVKFPSVEVDLPAMMAQKNKAVANLTRGIEGLFKKNKVNYVKKSWSLELATLALEMGSVWGRLGSEFTVVEFEPDIVPTMDSELTRFATNVSGVYAIGDIIPGPTFAHKAEDDGVACLEFIAGKEGHVDYDMVHRVVYTHPEVAYMGKTEEQVKALGFDYRVRKFPFLANSRAKAFDDAEGVVKILAYKETDKILWGLYHGTKCWGVHSRGGAG
ncbi:mitochondrial lipoamide dehydrogenase 1 [Actinidia rufa]|uniref:Mitochondrial lipoamide dehydrogenase 1 n=1 Tax=Actinidia rufa TaxID=165716 RepID=A0A7J0GLI8_9ERIC|nr:mitochondrial lipoamide dehydrogenase 1 [Actinidia rufa]